MILANVIFGPRRRHDPSQLEDIVETYLAALGHSGQRCGDRFLTWTKGRLNAHVVLADLDAMEPRHHSPWGKKALREVIRAFGAKPVWRILDDEVRQPTISWKGAPFLYLFTHAFDWASPVCRGDGGPPIPVYKLRIPFDRKESLYFWQHSYRDHDSIWLGSGVLEVGAYRQLADPESELARLGRELCQDIEGDTGVPTFYYLTRYWGRIRGEDRRPCPGCGGAWSTNIPAEPKRSFWQFEFKCDHCRLVSDLGVSTDGGRHTRIGEFNERRKTKAGIHRT